MRLCVSRPLIPPSPPDPTHPPCCLTLSPSHSPPFPADLEPHFEPGHLIGALDLVGAVVEGAGQASSTPGGGGVPAELGNLLRNLLTSPPGSGLPGLLSQALPLRYAGVRQAGFALLGELAKWAPATLGQQVRLFFGAITVSLRAVKGNYAAATNAAWALSMLVDAVGTGAVPGGAPALEEAAPGAVSRLVGVLRKPGGSRHIVENTVGALGRMGVHARAAFPVGLVAGCVHVWARGLLAMGEGDRAIAYAGFAAVCGGRVDEVVQGGGLDAVLVAAAVSVGDPRIPPNVRAGWGGLLGGLQAQGGGRPWADAWARARDDVKTKMAAW